MHSNHTTGYYKKLAELQAKLKKSEEERFKLEEKFSAIMKSCHEQEENKLLTLRQRYEKFLEEDRKRQDRNERILQILDRIEAHAAKLSAKSERLRLLRKHYEAYLLHLYPIWKRKCMVEKTGSQIVRRPFPSNASDEAVDSTWRRMPNMDSNLFGATLQSSIDEAVYTPTLTAQQNMPSYDVHSTNKMVDNVLKNDLHTINDDRTIENYVNMASNLLNVPKDELEGYEKCDEEKSFHTEQDTSRDLLNVSLSDDGILVDKKADEAVPAKAEERTSKMTVREIKEEAEFEKIKADAGDKILENKFSNDFHSEDDPNMTADCIDQFPVESVPREIEKKQLSSPIREGGRCEPRAETCADRPSDVWDENAPTLSREPETLNEENRCDENGENAGEISSGTDREPNGEGGVEIDPYDRNINDNIQQYPAAQVHEQTEHSLKNYPYVREEQQSGHNFPKQDNGGLDIQGEQYTNENYQYPDDSQQHNFPKQDDDGGLDVQGELYTNENYQYPDDNQQHNFPKQDDDGGLNVQGELYTNENYQYPDDSQQHYFPKQDDDGGLDVQGELYTNENYQYPDDSHQHNFPKQDYNGGLDIQREQYTNQNRQYSDDSQQPMGVNNNGQYYEGQMNDNMNYYYEGSNDNQGHEQNHYQEGSQVYNEQAPSQGYPEETFVDNFQLNENEVSKDGSPQIDEEQAANFNPHYNISYLQDGEGFGEARNGADDNKSSPHQDLTRENVDSRHPEDDQYEIQPDFQNVDTNSEQIERLGDVQGGMYPNDEELGESEISETDQPIGNPEESIPSPFDGTNVQMHQQSQGNERTKAKIEPGSISALASNNLEVGENFQVDGAVENHAEQLEEISNLGNQPLSDEERYNNEISSNTKQEESSGGGVIDENATCQPLVGSASTKQTLAEADSSESTDNSNQGFSPYGTNEVKSLLQIPKSEADSVVASDQDDVEEQLAALVDNPVSSFPETAVSEEQNNLENRGGVVGKDASKEAMRVAISAPSAPSAPSNCNLQKESKSNGGFEGKTETTKVTSKKNPGLIKILESDSESLNLNESVTDSNEFDFSTD